MYIKRYDLEKAKIEAKIFSPTFADTYCAINIRHLQAAFYLLMLGYVLAVVCFVTEIMWKPYRLMGREPTNLSLLYGQAEIDIDDKMN